MNVTELSLLALVEAYRARVAPAADADDDAEIARFLLQEINNPNGAESLSSSLDDKPGVVSIAPSLLIALFRSALQAQSLDRLLANSTREADEAWLRIDDAHRIMSSKANGSTGERQSKALKRIGLGRQPRNKGGVKPLYRQAADLYFNIRSGGLGGLVTIDGVLQQIGPHSHDEAVAIVEKLARISWSDLNRAWKRHGIQVRTRAQVFPIKTSRRKN